MIRILTILLLLNLSIPALGFVENVGHGYQNCMACHISPSGGGVLNDYGRSLSSELMSTWTWKNAEKPLFGAFENKEWFKFGGDYRVIQTYFENSEVKEGKKFDMQKNVELAFKISQFWVVGTLGTQEGPERIPGKGDFLSERHYVLWDLTDEIKLRAGKTRLNFGLSDPNHSRVTKQPLGFGLNSESYILEFAKFSEVDEVFISADLGRLDRPQSPSEKSFSVNYARYSSETSKLGGSVLIGESLTARRSLLGLYGIGKFFNNSILKSEVDFQKSTLAASPDQDTDLIAAMISWGVQLAKGLQPYLILEHLQRDLSDPSSEQTATGVGVQWLPVPHLEFQAEYKKQNQKNSESGPSDVGWLVFHFYL